ncbi:hypothetical protein LLE49_10500 [Alicyclobacillus tolerans]|uniref:hypothetical protein n=1 Tax=Alicyclobacillus tolerans TaxID=90970 RepID=UPI001F2D5253|nr:hypothetical protein [Alicyclobacillus tolerans]MCF8565144.1 hypothetical protein [Alicyclobacillus tolerans]
MESKHVTTTIPVQVSVHTISTNSGVYVGQRNVMTGLSQSSKSNTGFGTIGSRNYVYKNSGIVFDQDYIDTAIDDRDVKILVDTAPDESAVTNIVFESMAVATMTQNAGVFIGDTRISGLDSHSKDNVGFGKVYGNQSVHHSNLGINYDPDLMDTPINDQDIKSGVNTNK